MFYTNYDDSIPIIGVVLSAHRPWLLPCPGAHHPIIEGENLWSTWHVRSCQSPSCSTFGRSAWIIGWSSLWREKAVILKRRSPTYFGTSPSFMLLAIEEYRIYIYIYVYHRSIYAYTHTYSTHHIQSYMIYINHYSQLYPRYIHFKLVNKNKSTKIFPVMLGG